MVVLSPALILRWLSLEAQLHKIVSLWILLLGDCHILLLRTLSKGIVPKMVLARDTFAKGMVAKGSVVKGFSSKGVVDQGPFPTGIVDKVITTKVLMLGTSESRFCF